MPSSETLLFEAPDFGFSFRVKLLTKANPALVEKVVAELPMETVLHHVLFSGRAIYMPTKIVDNGSGNMVTRRLGDVYLYQPSAQICITYNNLTPESAPVNKFGEVFEEDLPKLIELGELVKQQTVVQAQRKIIVVKIQKPEDGKTRRQATPSISAVAEPEGHWRHAVTDINKEIERVWLSEPEEIQRLRQNDTSPPTLFFINSYLLQDGPNIGSKLLAVAEDEEMTLPLIVRLTRNFFTQPFDHFLFLSDLGLPRMKEIGEVYMNSLSTLASLDDYRQLTAPLVILLNRMQKWMHLIYDHGGLKPEEKVQIVY